MLETTPEFPLSSVDNEDSKIKIPLRNLNLNLNEFPLLTQKKVERRENFEIEDEASKENMDPNYDDMEAPSPSTPDFKEIGHDSLNLKKATSVPLSNSSKSAFEPFRNSKTTAIDSGNFKDSLDLITKIEKILSTKHEAQVEAPPKMDYALCLNLVSSLWTQTPSQETERLYHKHKVLKHSGALSTTSN